MGVYNTTNSRGFGKVMPVSAINVVKLLWSRGIEQFPYYYSTHQPYTSYLYVVTGGADEIISVGQAIANGTLP